MHQTLVKKILRISCSGRWWINFYDWWKAPKEGGWMNFKMTIAIQISISKERKHIIPQLGCVKSFRGEWHAVTERNKLQWRNIVMMKGTSFLILRQDTKLNDHYNPEKTVQHWTQAIRFFVTKTIQNTTLCKKILLIVFWDSNQMYVTDTLKLGWLNCVRYIQMLKHLRRRVCLVWQSRAKNSAAQ